MQVLYAVAYQSFWLIKSSLHWETVKRMHYSPAMSISILCSTMLVTKTGVYPGNWEGGTPGGGSYFLELQNKNESGTMVMQICQMTLWPYTQNNYRKCHCCEMKGGEIQRFPWLHHIGLSNANHLIKKTKKNQKIVGFSISICVWWVDIDCHSSCFFKDLHAYGTSQSHPNAVRTRSKSFLIDNIFEMCQCEIQIHSCRCYGPRISLWGLNARVGRLVLFYWQISLVMAFKVVFRSVSIV